MKYKHWVGALAYTGMVFLGIQIFSSLMYTIKLAEFHGEEWELRVHGIVPNGEGNRSPRGGLVSVRDLKSVAPEPGSGIAAEWCPGITSDRGRITLSSVGSTGVCCWVGDGQQLVPFKDEEGYRHYLCGRWPHLDQVRQSLDAVVIKLSHLP